MRRDRQRSAVEVIERIAVSWRFGDRLHCHAAGIARPILEDERLAEQWLERARERPCTGFRRAADGVADHEANRFAGIALSESTEAGGRQGAEGCGPEHTANLANCCGAG